LSYIQFMWRQYISILIFFHLTFSIDAQHLDLLSAVNAIHADRYFRISYDNDIIAPTDRNYTQGASFEFVAPALSKNPVNYLFFAPRTWTKKYGVELKHMSFTPDDYGSSNIQFGDRPFASALMLNSFQITLDTNRRMRLSQSLSLGVIGPAALGEEVQTLIHRATNNVLPLGWTNQIQNDLVLNYHVIYEKSLINYRNIVGLNAHADLQIGSLFTNLSLGTTFQLGLFQDVFSANSFPNVRCYLYAQPIIHLVGYDATLQGGLLNKSSAYTLASNEIERVTGQLNYGLCLKLYSFYAAFHVTSLTREFGMGIPARWGGIRIGLTFN
jgi:lipid A 3-O-deacylase